MARKCCTCRWWRPPAVECCCTVLGAGPCCLLSRRPRLHLLDRQGGFMFATHLPSAASWRGWARRSCCSRRGTGCAACGAALVCSAPRCRCARARVCVCMWLGVLDRVRVCVARGAGGGVCMCACQAGASLPTGSHAQALRRRCQLAAMLRPCGAARLQPSGCSPRLPEAGMSPQYPTPRRFPCACCRLSRCCCREPWLCCTRFASPPCWGMP